MKIEKLELSKIVVEPLLSGRTDNEIKENAKALAPSMKAAGGWDESQPGQVFKRNGNLHLLSGFTRYNASILNGETHGYFVTVPDEPASIRTACIRTNLGKPISPFEQGRIYVGMKDGTNIVTAKAGETVLAPMEIKDIAAAVGFTRQHIENCIAIFTETPEIAALIVDGKISAGVAVKAKQWIKDDAKRLKMLEAAVKIAASEDKKPATQKHLDAVKSEFVELKAVTIKGDAEKPYNNDSVRGKTDAELEQAKGIDEKPDVTELPGTETVGTIRNEKPLVERYSDKIMEIADERGIALTQADADTIADELISISGI
jgi:hypothetical protein